MDEEVKCLAAIKALEPMSLAVPTDDVIREAMEQLCILLIDGLLLQVYQAKKSKSGPLQILAPNLKCKHSNNDLGTFALGGHMGRSAIDSTSYTIGVRSAPAPSSKLTKHHKFSITELLASSCICFRGKAISRKSLLTYISADRMCEIGDRDRLDAAEKECTFTITNSSGVEVWKTPVINVESMCLCQHVFTSADVQWLMRKLSNEGDNNA